MAARVPARLTTREGRRFGLTIGGAFLALAALAWWRERIIAADWLAGLGAAFFLAGLLVPTYLGPVERSWMKLAHAISFVTTPVMLGVMYFGIITPVGLMRRWFAENPIEHRASETGFWKARPAGKRRSASMERQF
jgi:hypothetical protein